ncbi:ATP-binding cassette domain-containing protein [Candidatus Calescamantes bacterium]|nr:ATP-binding cassette domain-containing protein [Candidatus Calescamantes bacterium]
MLPLILMLEVKNLEVKLFPSHRKVLKNLSFNLKEGESLAILGASGSGRTILLYTLTGIIPEYIKGEVNGDIILGGKKINEEKLKERAHKIGILFEDFEAQLFSTSVELELAFGPENLGLGREEISQRIEKYLQLTGILHLKRREPSTLSGGEKQRTALASILTLEPQLLLLDKPVTDLDPKGRKILKEILAKLKKEGKSIIICEDEIEELYSQDKFLLLKDGEVIKEGRREEVLKDENLLLDTGINPPFLARLSNYAGWDTLPENLEEAKKRLEKEGWKLKPVTSPPSPTRKPLLEVKEVTHAYEKGKEVIKNVSFTVGKGEFFALIGENGAGKTTLLEIINGLITPSKGKIFLEGEEVKKIPPQKLAQKVGYLFQNPDHQIFCSTVKEEVEFTLRLLKFPEKEIQMRVEEALRAVKLEDKKEEDPFSLSKGERQRLALASLLVRRPSLILLDEPSTGLSYKELQGFMSLLKKLHEEGTTILMTTHNLSLVCEYAERCLWLEKGEIRLLGEPREVFTKMNKMDSPLPLPPWVSLSQSMGVTLLSWEEWKNSLFKT